MVVIFENFRTCIFVSFVQLQDLEMSLKVETTRLFTLTAESEGATIK